MLTFQSEAISGSLSNLQLQERGVIRVCALESDSERLQLPALFLRAVAEHEPDAGKQIVSIGV